MFSLHFPIVKIFFPHYSTIKIFFPRFSNQKISLSITGILHALFYQNLKTLKEKILKMFKHFIFLIFRLLLNQRISCCNNYQSPQRTHRNNLAFSQNIKLKILSHFSCKDKNQDLTQFFTNQKQYIVFWAHLMITIIISDRQSDLEKG